jgi:xylose isomerase
MKKWKFSVNATFLGKRHDRFTQYQPERPLKDKIRLAAKIDGVEGVELKYPKDFKDINLIKGLLETHGMVCSAVNVDIKDATHFRFGALSNNDPDKRRKAVELLQEGLDTAAEMGIDLVTTCPLADGYDYPFQIDYSDAWEYFIESIKVVAARRQDVRLALEFQPHEPHARIMLSNVGILLHVLDEVALDNVGANLDIGHSFAALETPAESVALLARKGRLFYLHTNDNTGDGGDWDMISGSVHFWHWLELLLTLDRVGYEGWLGADINPKHMRPEQAFAANNRMIRNMIEVLTRLGPDKLAEMVRENGNTGQIYDYLGKQLMS